MNLDLKGLLAKTNLVKKNCVRKFLEDQGFTTLPAINNLPGRYGQPWLCENGTTAVVSEINRVIKEEAVAVPTIDEVIETVQPEPEPATKALSGSTPIYELEIEGVTKRQLDAIRESGIETVGDLFENKEALEQVPGIGKATKEKILQAVTQALERK